MFLTFGVAGDDAGEFMGAFYDEFDPNMDRYRGYFHHQNKPTGGLISTYVIKSLWARVERLPITISVLAQSVSDKKWRLAFPAHSIKIRWSVKTRHVLFYALANI